MDLGLFSLFGFGWAEPVINFQEITNTILLDLYYKVKHIAIKI
jgi:hypothetical protein